MRLMSDGIAGLSSDIFPQPWALHSMTGRDSCAVQHVYYVDEMAAVLADMGPAALHLLSGTNTDSGRKTTVCIFQSEIIPFHVLVPKSGVE